MLSLTKSFGCRARTLHAARQAATPADPVNASSAAAAAAAAKLGGGSSQREPARTFKWLPACAVAGAAACVYTANVEQQALTGREQLIFSMYQSSQSHSQQPFGMPSLEQPAAWRMGTEGTQLLSSTYQRIAAAAESGKAFQHHLSSLPEDIQLTYSRDSLTSLGCIHFNRPSLFFNTNDPRLSYHGTAREVLQSQTPDELTSLMAQQLAPVLCKHGAESDSLTCSTILSSAPWQLHCGLAACDPGEWSALQQRCCTLGSTWKPQANSCGSMSKTTLQPLSAEQLAAALTACGQQCSDLTLWTQLLSDTQTHTNSASSASSGLWPASKTCCLKPGSPGHNLMTVRDCRL